MALLAGTCYDPGTAVSKSTASLLAMTAIDTTNLRLTFTAPQNGAVLVRLRGAVHGATTFPQILLGVLDGSAIKGRQAPIGSLKTTAVATAQLAQEARFVVTGLTPGTSYTWDAAYGVELVIASTGLKYGGPDNTTTDDAWGGFEFEIWEATNLLAGTLYDPGTAVATSATNRLAMTALDTTNLRLSFTGPSSGKVLVKIRALVMDQTTFPTILLGVLDGATVKGRQSPVGGLLGTALATTRSVQEASFLVSVTTGTAYTWDAAWGVEILLASTNLRYGGPNDTTTNNAYGGLAYEIWAA